MNSECESSLSELNLWCFECFPKKNHNLKGRRKYARPDIKIVQNYVTGFLDINLFFN